MEFQRNYVQDGLRGYSEDGCDRRPVNESEDDDPILKEINFYKERLHKKIDGCFLKYGLEGLRNIDEGIAYALDRYIKGLKGELAPERRAEPAPVAESMRQPAQPRPFQKPVRIQAPPQQRSAPSPVPDMSSQFNMDVINKVLTDIIPPTDIHQVEVKSSIPVQSIMEARQNQGAVMAPQTKMAEHIDGDSMIEVGNEEAGSQLNPLLPENDQQIVPQSQPQQGRYDIVNDILDGQSVREAEHIGLMGPTEYDYKPGMEEEEDMGGVIEVMNETPIDVKSTRASTSRKSKKKG